MIIIFQVFVYRVFFEMLRCHGHPFLINKKMTIVFFNEVLYAGVIFNIGYIHFQTVGLGTCLARHAQNVSYLWFGVEVGHVWLELPQAHVHLFDQILFGIVTHLFSRL